MPTVCNVIHAFSGYWIGLRGDGYGFTWEDGRPLEGKPYESGLTGCAFHDSQREDLQWDVVDCGEQHWFVCQKPRSTPGMCSSLNPVPANHDNSFLRQQHVWPCGRVSFQDDISTTVSSAGLFWYCIHTFLTGCRCAFLRVTTFDCIFDFGDKIDFN